MSSACRAFMCIWRCVLDVMPPGAMVHQWCKCRGGPSVLRGLLVPLSTPAATGPEVLNIQSMMTLTLP